VTSIAYRDEDELRFLPFSIGTPLALPRPVLISLLRFSVNDESGLAMTLETRAIPDELFRRIQSERFGMPGLVPLELS